MYRSSALNVITDLGMCKVCTEAVHCIALGGGYANADLYLPTFTTNMNQILGMVIPPQQGILKDSYINPSGIGFLWLYPMEHMGVDQPQETSPKTWFLPSSRCPWRKIAQNHHMISVIKMLAHLRCERWHLVRDSLTSDFFQASCDSCFHAHTGGVPPKWKWVDITSW